MSFERETQGGKSLAAQCREIATAAMREGIFQAALKVIRERGFEGLTMDRLAEVAGVAKGSIYNYFATKQSLMEFIFERVVGPALERARQVAASALSPVEKLRGILREWANHFASYRGVFEIMFADPVIRHFCADARRGKYSEGVAIFQSVFQEGVQQGLFRPIDPHLVAEVLVGALVLPVERDLESGRVRSPEEWADNLLDMLLWGLAGKAISGPIASAGADEAARLSPQLAPRP
ncbi:MAG: TetR/AcrR family transcriptional regulator [Thermoguttaceae bacterium]|nr:TetR/AcrR family transcriptional regulator [Thermoguttaceae bacterium]MDW8078331.1 TetR/AcrR family transcriptional regulator [Thermoguttaceae bacterium]